MGVGSTRVKLFLRLRVESAGGEEGISGRGLR